MILMHRVALGGVQLDSVDNRIMVKGVATQAPNEKPITAQLAGDGARYMRTKRESLDVNVRIGLRIYDDDMDDREELMEQVVGWANSLPAWLTTDQKPGRRLWVESVKVPAMGDPAEWTNEFTFAFTAQSSPWWEDSTATTKTLAQNDAGSDSITMPGNTETIGEASIQNKSGSTINTLTLTINGHSMSFTSLGLANNGTLVIDHARVGGVTVLRAKIGSTSVLAKRTGADEFILKPGSNAISYEAGGDVIITVSARGRYK